MCQGHEICEYVCKPCHFLRSDIILPHRTVQFLEGVAMTYQEWSRQIMQVGLFAEPIHDRQIGSPVCEKGEIDVRQEIQKPKG